jgi:CRP/FNR family transcriptional regulator, dissimilatory nitrate respiration regulator
VSFRPATGSDVKGVTILDTMPDGLGDLLEKAPLFEGLAAATLARIASGAAALEIQNGDTIFRQGEPCRGIHVVACGEVELALKTRRARTVVEIAGPGAILGVAWMFMNRRHALTATALSDTRLVHLKREPVQQAVEHDALFARRMIAHLCESLQIVLTDVEYYTLRTGTQRVIGYLLAQLPRGARTLVLPAKKSVIAMRLKLTQEHFSRILHELSITGMIEVAGREIRILDLSRLRTHGS